MGAVAFDNANLDGRRQATRVDDIEARVFSGDRTDAAGPVVDALIG